MSETRRPVSETASHWSAAKPSHDNKPKPQNQSCWSAAISNSDESNAKRREAAPCFQTTPNHTQQKPTSRLLISSPVGIVVQSGAAGLPRHSAAARCRRRCRRRCSGRTLASELGFGFLVGLDQLLLSSFIRQCLLNSRPNCCSAVWSDLLRCTC